MLILVTFITVCNPESSMPESPTEDRPPSIPTDPEDDHSTTLPDTTASPMSSASSAPSETVSAGK